MADERIPTHVHRYYCTVLQEMRDTLRNMTIFNRYRAKPMLYSLMEELQTIGNRMEAGLEYGGDLKHLHELRAKLASEVKQLKAERDSLKPSKDEDD